MKKKLLLIDADLPLYRFSIGSQANPTPTLEQGIARYEDYISQALLEIGEGEYEVWHCLTDKVNFRKKINNIYKFYRDWETIKIKYHIHLLNVY